MVLPWVPDTATVFVHDLSQQMGTVSYTDAFFMGCTQFRVVVMDGRGVYHQGNVISDVFRTMSEVDVDAQALQMFGDSCFFYIGADRGWQGFPPDRTC